MILKKQCFVSLCLALAACGETSKDSTTEPAEEYGVAPINDVSDADLAELCTLSVQRDALVDGCVAHANDAPVKWRIDNADLLKACHGLDLDKRASTLAGYVGSDGNATARSGCEIVVDRLVAGQEVYRADGVRPSLFTSVASFRGKGPIDTSKIVKVWEQANMTHYVDPATITFISNLLVYDRVVVRRELNGTQAHKREIAEVDCDKNASRDGPFESWDYNKKNEVRLVCNSIVYKYAPQPEEVEAVKLSAPLLGVREDEILVVSYEVYEKGNDRLVCAQVRSPMRQREVAIHNGAVTEFHYDCSYTAQLRDMRRVKVQLPTLVGREAPL